MSRPSGDEIVRRLGGRAARVALTRLRALLIRNARLSNRDRLAERRLLVALRFARAFQTPPSPALVIAAARSAGATMAA